MRKIVIELHSTQMTCTSHQQILTLKLASHQRAALMTFHLSANPSCFASPKWIKEVHSI